MQKLQTYATFVTDPIQRELFMRGALVEEWHASYPMLFDERDKEIACHQRHGGYHYYEWLAAILIYQTTGLLSLVEFYPYQSHERKWRTMERLTSGPILDFIAGRGKSSLIQCPDLLVYSADDRDWFFCEVKGPRDRLREKQLTFFEELARVTGKEIKVVRFRNSGVADRPAEPRIDSGVIAPEG